MALPSRQSTGGLANRALNNAKSTVAPGLRPVTREEMITSGRLRQNRQGASSVTPRQPLQTTVETAIAFSIDRQACLPPLSTLQQPHNAIGEADSSVSTLPGVV